MVAADGPAFVAAAVKAAILARAPRRTVQGVAAAVAGVFRDTAPACAAPTAGAQECAGAKRAPEAKAMEQSPAELVEALRQARRAQRKLKKARKRDARAGLTSADGQDLKASTEEGSAKEDMQSDLVQDSKALTEEGSAMKDMQSELPPVVASAAAAGHDVLPLPGGSYAVGDLSELEVGAGGSGPSGARDPGSGAPDLAEVRRRCADAGGEAQEIWDRLVGLTSGAFGETVLQPDEPPADAKKGKKKGKRK